MMAVYPLLWILGLMCTFGGCVSAAGAKTVNQQGAASSALLLGVMFLIGAWVLWIFGIVNAYRTAERTSQTQLIRAQRT